MSSLRAKSLIIVSSLFVLVGINKFNPGSSLTFEDELHATPHARSFSPLPDYGKKHSVHSCLANLTGLERTLVESAIESDVDPRLLLAVMKVESGCNSAARSPKGAVGLMQILPSTAKTVGFNNPRHPKENIRAGAKYLGTLKDKYNSNLELTLAAYNAGPGAVSKFKGVPPYGETKRYVSKVMKVYREYSRTRPEKV